MMRSASAAVVVTLCLACAGSSEEASGDGTGRRAGGAAGRSGEGGASARGGTAGKAGKAGADGEGGNTGTGAASGRSGTGGKSGAGGSSVAGGKSGAAGKSGAGGKSGGGGSGGAQNNGTGGKSGANAAAGSGAGGTGDGGSGAGATGAAGAGAGTTAGAGGSQAPAPLPYPTRTAMRLKGLQPDFHPNKDEVSGNNTGGVAMNLLWLAWEPAPKSAPCNADEEEYDGRCFRIDGPVDAAIADWTARGMVVTAVAYGSPPWSRTNHPCSPQAPGFDIFCTPDDMADYGRFMGMIARRYNGLRGHGRLADFVIWNEVNANDWFDIGCGQGVPCNPAVWLDSYAAMYTAAYDRVVAEQPSAKVLASLEHHFGSVYDDPAATHPMLGGKTVIDGLAARVGARSLRVAWHPYPPDLLAPQFSPDDFPRITYGNIGAIVGYLRAAYPDRPSSWEVQLTESGVNSIGKSSPAAQADGVCTSLRNVVGTPGIESYIYHRMHDHPDETKYGLALGLWDDKGQPKPAWTTWALANRDDLSPKQLSCGFEDLPYVRLRRSSHKSRGHWSSTRRAPVGFVEERSYRLHHDPQPASHPLFECLVGGHTFLSPAASCEGQTPMGPVGYAWDGPGDGRAELFRCAVAAGADHFVTTDPGCEGQTKEQSLGFVLP